MRHRLGRIILAFLVLTIRVCSHSPCPCEVPTPCLTINDGQSKCSVPVLTNISQCPEKARDCRESTQTLCEVTEHAEDGFCCWTACSSLAVLRKCGKSPRGFEFEKEVGVRNNSECVHPLNVRERCCLRELHTMKTVEARSSQCPKEGHDLVTLFDKVDGNGKNPANAVISPYEAMSSLQMLQARGHRFVADDFHKIDVNHNHEVSWYELQLFCGHTGEKIPADEINEIKPSNIFSILQNPLYFAALVSSLVFGELIGLFMVFCKHAAGAMGLDYAVEESLFIRLAYVFLAHIWPVVYVGIMWWYYFTKIQWEVCDKDNKLQQHFAIVALAPTCIKISSCVFWVRRGCPFRPSVDLERKCFLQQESFRKCGKCLSFVFKCLVAGTVFWSLYRATCFGDLGLWFLSEFDDVVSKECRHEDPDLALIFEVNEEFFLWNVFSVSFLNLYTLISLPILNKSYAQLPAEEFVLPLPMVSQSEAKDKFIQELYSASESERKKWSRFQ